MGLPPMTPYRRFSGSTNGTCQSLSMSALPMGRISRGPNGRPLRSMYASAKNGA
jgi:hypothetical protein